jgi:hypothetical protein
MAEEKEEFKFPMVFDSCPNCGCKETIIQVALKEYVEKGQAKIDDSTAIFRFGTMLLNPSQAIIKMPMLATVLNGCPRCGTAFFSKVEIQDVPVTGKLGGPKQGPQMPPIFGQG